MSAVLASFGGPFMWVALPALVLLAALFGPSCAVLALAALTGEQRSPSDAHPAARAVRGWERISDEEAAEFRLIEFMLAAGVETPEPEYKTPRGEQ